MKEHDKLAKRALQGEREAFEELVKIFQKAVFKIAYSFVRDKEDAMEILQDTFLKAYENLPSYKMGSNFKNWLLRICTNLSIDRYRKFKKTSFITDNIEDNEFRIPHASENPEAELEEKRAYEYISDRVKSLSSKQQKVFILRYKSGLKNREISEILNINEGTVKSLLFRAVKKIRESFESGGEI